MKLRAAYIRKITMDLIKENNYKPPIPVEELAVALGLKIRKVSIDYEIDAKLDANKKTIVVNEAQKNFERQRFTLAHELGHYVLKHYVNPWEFEDPETGESFIEKEADEFAGSLLLPKEFLSEHVKSGIPVSELRALYQVSNQALWVRLDIYRLTKFLSS